MSKERLLKRQLVGVVLGCQILLSFQSDLLANDSKSQTSTPYQVSQVEEQSNVSVSYEFNLKTPVFSPSSTYSALNGAIKSARDDMIARVLGQGAVTTLNRSGVLDQSDAMQDAPPLKNSVTADFEVNQNNQLTSVVMNMEGYVAPSAHPFHTINTFNFDIKKGSMVFLADIFNQDARPLLLLSNLSREQLKAKNLPDQATLIEGTAPLPSNFEHWLISSKGLVIYFDDYQVAPYSSGQQTITIPLDQLKPSLSPYGLQLSGIASE